MNQVQRIHKSTVKALLRRGNIWEGYLVPNNVNSYHVNNGWHIGIYVSVSSIEELENMISRYEMESGYFPSELGNRTVLWELTSAAKKELAAMEEARVIYQALAAIMANPDLSAEEKKEEICKISIEHNRNQAMKDRFLNDLEPVNLDQ